MLYREIIAVCSEIHTKHINVKVLNVILCSKGVLSDGGHKEHVRLQRTTAMTSTPPVTQTSSPLPKTSATTKGYSEFDFSQGNCRRSSHPLLSAQQPSSLSAGPKGSGATTPVVLHLHIRRRRVVSFRPRLPYPDNNKEEAERAATSV